MSLQYPRLGAVLGWKHNHVQGIRTVEGWLTEWPPSLGPFPSDTQLQAWIAEFEAWEALQPRPKTRAQLLTDVDAATTVDQLKAIVKELIR